MESDMVRGSVTVYLALIFTLVMGLFCTIVESGRVSAVIVKSEGITHMAFDSCFSKFARPLLEDYGLLFLWSTQSEIEESAKEYIEYNCDLEKGVLSKNADLYSIGLKKVKVEKLVKATDQEGQVFANQVKKYMKYAIVGDLLERLLEETNLFNQGSKVRTFYDKIETFSNKLTEVEEKVGEIKKKVDEVQETFENPEELIEELLLQGIKVQEKISVNEEFTQEAENFKKKFNDVKKSTEKLANQLEKIKESTKNYYDATENAEMVMEELNTTLFQTKEDLGEEMYRILDDEVKDISVKSTINSQDFYGVQGNEIVAEEILKKLEKANDFFNQGNKDLNKVNVAENISLLEKIKKELQNSSLERLQIKLNFNEAEEEEGSIIDSVNKIINDGVLGYVVPDASSISEKAISSQGIPSLEVESQEFSEDLSFVEGTTEKLIFSEYLLNYFGNYVEEKKDTALSYEVEYILAGKNSDRDNLASVVKKMILLREGCNLIYLLKDSQKRGEAYQMASSLVGFTGMPLLITITQFLILGAWALAESVVDVKNLLEEKKVSIIKKDSEWNLSLFGVKNLKGNLSSDKNGGPGALSYSQYLRMLLLMQKKKTQYYYTMDLIQLNTCKNHNPSFRMKDCIDSGVLESEFSVKPLFTTFPFVKKLHRGSQGRYNFKIRLEYSY